MGFSKVPLIFFYLLKFCLVSGQWNNGLYFPKNSPTNTYSLPLQYVPASTFTNQDSLGSCRRYDSFPNCPFSYDPYPINYLGEAEVTSLQSSYPGQPVIVINNGGYGDFCKREREFDIEELLTLMFAVGGEGRHRHKPEREIPREEPHVPRYPSSYPYYGYPGGDVSENIKPRESPKSSKINITIILPSTFSSTNVQVENNNKEVKKNSEDIDKVISNENE